VPILEENQVWSTDDDTRTSYLDSQDVAKMTMAALRNKDTYGDCLRYLSQYSHLSAERTLTLAGPKAYTTDEIIKLCEKRANAAAKVSKVNQLHS